VPKYTVPVDNLTTTGYTNGDDIFTALGLFSQNVPLSADDPKWLTFYPCMKTLANLWCSESYPMCPTNAAYPILPVCASVCRDVLTQCVYYSNPFMGNYTQYFNPSAMFQLPTSAFCSSLPDTNCFTPGNSTDMGFFFGSDPPQNITITPTIAPGIVYPPGGPGKGGGIGAAILVAILAFIGALMLLMKKQDAR